MSHFRDNSESIYEMMRSYLPERIRAALLGISTERFAELEEVRIRSMLPLMGVFRGEDRYIGMNGLLSDNPHGALAVTADEMRELFLLLCEHSIYAFQEDITRGFITLKGGHRAGICGTVIYDGDKITGMRDISSVCIRISRQLKGCARGVMDHIVRGYADLYNTLILSPPRCGKTTLLRDLCRLVSSGLGNGAFKGLRVAVIDERSEIAAGYRGIPQNDLGPRTDILDGCRKSDGIAMMLRGMAPHVIMVDELGGPKDSEAVKMAWNAGVRLVATAHAFSLEDFKKRAGVGHLAEEEGFERVILIGMNKGKRWTRVMDTNGNEYYADGEDIGVHDGIGGMHHDGPEACSKASGEAACALEAFGYPA